MQEFIYKKLIVFLILFCPLIDIVTSFMVIKGITISIGIFVKLFIMFLALIYLIFIDKKNKYSNYYVIIILFIFSILNILNNIDIIKINLLDYFSYLFKYLYNLIILLFFLRWYKHYEIKLYELRIPIFIVAISYFVAFFTNTAFFSYGGNSFKIGYSGWYSSANELGNLLCLLLPIALYNAFHNKDGIFLDKILFVLISISMLLIGTKVGLFGYFIILFGYLIIRLFFIKKEHLDKSFLFIIIMLLLPIIFYKNIPGIYNLNIGYDKYGKVDKMLLNGRDEFFKQMLELRKNTNFYDKLVGKSFINDLNNEIVLIEEDFYDIYFMYGIVGCFFIVLLYGTIYYLFIVKVRIYLKNPKTFSKKYLAVFFAVTLELFAAFIAGHSLLSPSVSTYLTMLIALSLSIDIKNKTTKKVILIDENNPLIDKIDFNKYEIIILSIVYYKSDNAWHPYGYFSKLIKKKFYQKILCSWFVQFNLIRNHRYDYIIMNENKLFSYLLRNSNGKCVYCDENNINML